MLPSTQLMPLLAAIGMLGMLAASSGDAAPTRTVVGCITDIPSETASARAERHRKVAERRAGTVVTLHRGASAFAPENTLEAYAAAMDYGADGCEIDLRRGRDGVLYLFHDDMLDRLTDGFGAPNSLTYLEMLSLTPRLTYGAATTDMRPPTFAAVIALARQRAMLLHLDIKEPGIDGDIAGMLDEADMWDHVVSVSPYNSENLRANPKLAELHYKAPGLFEQRTDWDPAAVREALAKPGQMIIVDDPRVAARELKRPACKPVPLPEGLARAYCIPSAKTGPDPIMLLASEDPSRSQLDGDEAYQRERTERIVARAMAAQALAKCGTKRAIELLENLVRHRSLHRDWIYHGLDGAAAVRALGELGATDSVPMLIETFKTTDPELAKVANPQWKQNPLGWTDWRIKSCIISTLGSLRCEASKAFLMEYLAMDEPKAREMCFLAYDEATKSLLKQDLSRREIETLLSDPRPMVRGTAIQECIDHPTRSRTAAIRAVVPWAAELPRAAQSVRTQP